MFGGSTFPAANSGSVYSEAAMSPLPSWLAQPDMSVQLAIASRTAWRQAAPLLKRLLRGLGIILSRFKCVYANVLRHQISTRITR